MITLNLNNPLDDPHLCKINKLIAKSKKIVSLTGAGISCNAGIPDFRSTQGLYNMVKRKHPDCVVKGKDLFDISLFRDAKSVEVFCTFMESLYAHTTLARPTRTHMFIKRLQERNKLVKCYTQNIDGLERLIGLHTGTNGSWKELDVVQLHGDLNKLSCTNCFQLFDWTPELREQFSEGQVPDCPLCTDNFFSRMSSGKRMSSSTVGFLKPNIVLYGENHPHLETIARGLAQDLNKNPQLLIIFGTSLKVDGVKRLVRDMAKKVHLRDGLVVFVNKDAVASATWDKVIDYHIETDCDLWCDYLQTKIPDLFTDLYVTPPTTPTKRKLATKLDTKLDKLVPKKPDFTIYQDTNLTPEYSPVQKSPKRKLEISDKTLADISNITGLQPEEPSPLFSPLKKISQSPSVKRVPVELRRSKRLCLKS